MLEIAVDIGGTFTDVVVRKDGRLTSTKVPSLPDDLAQGVVHGVQKALQRAGATADDVVRFVHGTTVATNAIIEHSGAQMGILATSGFEDVLEIGRLQRSDPYNLFCGPETPVFLAPARRRFGISERVSGTGEVLVPLDEQAVQTAARDLVERQGCEAIAVCFLFSFLHPEHERRTRDIINDVYPDVKVSISSEVNPIFREYERTVATALDAYVRPRIVDYIERLQSAIAQQGIPAPLQIMQSRGGITGTERIVQRPVTALMSGPAGGVMAGRYLTDILSDQNLITLDMGGTSADIALIVDGRPSTSTEAKLATYPVRIPTLDVQAIGAGGGSIAWLDSANSLRVGPQSAGARPGPSCYGLGGTDATVTDASLVLGYLNPEGFADGELRLDQAAAERALSKLGEPLGLDPIQAALGIHRIVNAHMSDLIEIVSVKRGHDPRDFALVAFGGAGPLHAPALAQELGIQRVLVPATPGVFSAVGLLVSNIEIDHSISFIHRLSTVTLGDLQGAFSEVEAIGIQAISREHANGREVNVRRSAEMRFANQAYELEVEVPGPLDEGVFQRMNDSFYELHEAVYGYSSPAPVEFVNLRTLHWFGLPHPDPETVPSGSRAIKAKGSRLAHFFGGSGPQATAIYDRASLPAGAVIEGPAVIEQPDTTVLVPPAFRCEVHKTGTLILTTVATSQAN